MALHNSRRAVDIDHQAGQRITLAVHQSVAGSLLILSQVERSTHVVSSRNALVPPRLVDLDLLEGEHSYCDRTDLVVATRDEIAIFGMNIDDLALGYMVALRTDIFDCAREDPRVAAQERLLLAST